MARCCGIAQRSRWPALLIALFLSGVLVAAVWTPHPASQQNAQPNAAATPDDCLAAMIAAEKAGDLDGYLACFAGPLREAMNARLGAQTGGDPRAALMSQAAGLTGYTLTARQTTGSDRLSCVLERVTSDYNERQHVELQRSSGRWFIVKLTPMERYAPQIPYGTPVTGPTSE